MAETHQRPIAEQFTLFAEAIGDEVPLYSRLCQEIVQDQAMLVLAGHAMPGQPAANMLFGAVQYLLLDEVEHPLRAWYPAISGQDVPKQDPFPVFRDFCRRHEDEIAEIVATRRTQTNEVGRCLALLPALTTVAARADQPLALVELGASAGLLLGFDRYRYLYGNETWGPARSAVHLTTELRGARPPLPTVLPVQSRLGIDLHPVDITAEREARWLDALVWPGQEQRRRQLRAAISLVAPDPLRVVAGDALELLPAILDSVPAGVHPVVYHSFALIQWDSVQRDRLEEILRNAGRPLHRIWLEWFGYRHNLPLVRLFEYQEGTATTETLGRFHYHGAWLEWGWADDSGSRPIDS